MTVGTSMTPLVEGLFEKEKTSTVKTFAYSKRASEDTFNPLVLLHDSMQTQFDRPGSYKCVV